MQKKKGWIILLSAIAIIILFLLCFYIVDETQYTILTFFGKPIATVQEAGLYTKTPLHTTVSFDKRLLIYDPAPSEFLTRDKKNVIVDTFAFWKIIDPLTFYETAGSIESAETRLYDIVYSEVSSMLGSYDLSNLISTNPEQVKIDEIMSVVMNNCRERAKEDFSIDIVDVKLKQLILPQQNKQSVFDRMRAERERIAKRYKAEGEEEARKIRAKTDKEVRIILSEAYSEAQKIMGEGDAEAIKIYGEAYGTNPKFFELTRTLDAYKQFLDEKTTLVLSSDSDLLKLMTSGVGAIQ
ncbi:MAG: protease modulator HflC [bacterium]